MRFHFCNVNHTYAGRLTLLDMQDWIRAGLEELGHEVTISNAEVDPSAVNIFWENFNSHFAEQLRSLDLTYGIFATEIPDGEGFNNRREPEWIERYKCFPEVAKRAKFIWTTVEPAVDFYGKFAPTAFVEFGFSDKLVRRGLIEPKYDFSFFGLRTPHREEIIEQLRSSGCKVVWPNYLLDQKDLFELIDQSKIGLSFRQSSAWPIPSPTRLGRYMHAKRLIACEWTPKHTKQSTILRHPSETEDLVKFVFSLLESDWKAEGIRVFEEYRKNLPMRQCMENVLDQTLPASVKETGSQSSPHRLVGNPTPLVVDTLAGHNIIQLGNDFIGVPIHFGPTDLNHLEKLPLLRRAQISRNTDLDALKETIYLRRKIFSYSPAMIRRTDDIEVWDFNSFFLGIGRVGRERGAKVTIEAWKKSARDNGSFFYCTRDRSTLELKIAQHLAEGS